MHYYGLILILNDSFGDTKAKETFGDTKAKETCSLTCWV
jgi:hypothetical protein